MWDNNCWDWVLFIPELILARWRHVKSCLRHQELRWRSICITCVLPVVLSRKFNQSSYIESSSYFFAKMFLPVKQLLRKFSHDTFLMKPELRLEIPFLPSIFHYLSAETRYFVVNLETLALITVLKMQWHSLKGLTLRMEASRGDGLVAELGRRTIFVYELRMRRNTKDMSICVNMSISLTKMADSQG